MYQPSSTEIGSHDPQPERETVIKFVISGPFLNAEAAHTQWASEPPLQASAMQDLLRRIADLERKLDEERALVQMLSSQMPVAPAPELSSTSPFAPALAEPALPRAFETVAPRPASTLAAPAPPPLSTVVRTPPPKVRGLRRMIGALRHL
jgi:hypothetical protein